MSTLPIRKNEKTQSKCPLFPTLRMSKSTLPPRVCPVCDQPEEKDDQFIECGVCKKYTHLDCQDSCGICRMNSCLREGGIFQICQECEGSVFCRDCSSVCKKCGLSFCKDCLSGPGLSLGGMCKKCSSPTKRKQKKTSIYLFLTSSPYDPPTVKGKFFSEIEAVDALLGKLKYPIGVKEVIKNLVNGGFSEGDYDQQRFYSIRKITIPLSGPQIPS